MRTYGQYCSLAKTLDVLGDRWTLLIVRELLLRGPSRYTDLRAGLPGIATNLLADRLRELEAVGVVAREGPTPPVATALFRLTPRGEQLKRAVSELARWGLPLMVGGPAEGDVFRRQWLALPAQLVLRDSQPKRPPVTLEVHTDEGPVTIERAGRDDVRARAGVADDPDAVLSGSPHMILGLLSGQLDLERAEQLGLRCEGSRESVERLLPEPATAA